MTDVESFEKGEADGSQDAVEVSDAAATAWLSFGRRNPVEVRDESGSGRGRKTDSKRNVLDVFSGFSRKF